MANIKPYIDQIMGATYGEEVRGSIANALMKVNDDNESYQSIKTEVVNARDDIDLDVKEYKSLVPEGNQAKLALQNTIKEATAFKDAIDASVTSAGKAKTALDESIKIAETSKDTLNSSVKTAGTSKTALEESIKSADESKIALEKAKSTLDESIRTAGTSKATLDESVKTAGITKNSLDESITNANSSKTRLDGSVETANTAKTSLDSSVKTATDAKTALDGSVETANTAKKSLDTASSTVNASVTSAGKAKTALDESINASSTANTALNDTLKLANTSKENLDLSIEESAKSKTDLTTEIKNAGKSQTELTIVIGEANTTKENVNTIIETAQRVETSLEAENISAKSNISELRSENFNSQEILSGVADLRAYLGLSDADILGLQVDYQNKTMKRIAGAVNLTAGADFDKFEMFGGRKRCNVADDGTIVAYHGDPEYKEDGSMGQVMVYQPKFYYLVCPVVYDPIKSTDLGYHLRKANYYVSSKPRAGFRLHPAFYDENGNEIDYILMGAFEGSIYDTSAQAYLLQDEQVADFTASTGDKFSSIAGVRPATGVSQNLTRPNIEQLSKNRGAGWHLENAKIASMNQLLMMIEYGQMELQKPIGQGVVTLPWTTGSDTTSSYAGVTGSTSALGNETGRAERTTTYEGGVPKEYTVDGKTSVTYRGLENPWGNIWKLVYGVNIWGNGKMDGGQPYICKDFNYSESKNTDNYIGAGFTVTNKGGYISAMAYSPTCDWLFMASECLGNSSLPVGDYNWVTENLNGYRIAHLGGYWADGGGAGAFYWYLHDGVGYRLRNVGGRLVYVPHAVM